MPAILPLRAVERPDQSNVRLMNEPGRIERLPRFLVRELR